MKTVTLALVALVLATPLHAFGKANARQDNPFVVEVRDFYGVEGYTLHYHLDNSRLVVVLSDDFGSPPKEVLSKSLTKAEAKDWAFYLERFPIEQLKEDYTNRAVDDGLQQFFTFRTGGKEKKVAVRNVRVEELENLCQKLNRLIPEKDFRVRGPGYR